MRPWGFRSEPEDLEPVRLVGSEQPNVHAHRHRQGQRLRDIRREAPVLVATGPVRGELRQPELACGDARPIRLLLDHQCDRARECARGDSDLNRKIWSRSAWSGVSSPTSTHIATVRGSVCGTLEGKRRYW